MGSSATSVHYDSVMNNLRAMQINGFMPGAAGAVKERDAKRRSPLKSPRERQFLDAAVVRQQSKNDQYSQYTQTRRRKSMPPGPDSLELLRIAKEKEKAEKAAKQSKSNTGSYKPRKRSKSQEHSDRHKVALLKKTRCHILNRSLECS